MKKSITAITLTLLLVFTLSISVYAYWPNTGTNPFGTNVKYMSQFAENGTLYCAYTGELGYLTVKKCTNGVWETLGTENFTDNDSANYGDVQEHSIYVHNGVPYIAYLDHDNYTELVTVIKYDASTNSWDIIGKQIKPNDDLSHFSTSVKMYVSSSGNPYFLFTDDTMDNTYNQQSHVYMAFYGTNGWGCFEIPNTDMFLSSATSLFITEDGCNYAAYIGYDLTSGKSYLMLKMLAPNNSPVPTIPVWNSCLKMELDNSSSKAELRYDGNKFFLCVYTIDGAMSVYMHDSNPSPLYDPEWEKLGPLPFSGGTDYWSMTSYNGTPYVAYKSGTEYVNVVKYDGTNWVNVGYNTTGNVIQVELSNDENVFYLSTIGGYYRHANSYKYSEPVVQDNCNLDFSQTAGGYITITGGDGMATFSDTMGTISMPYGSNLSLGFHADTGFVINSVLIDGTEIIETPCATANYPMSMTRNHIIEVQYVAATNAVQPTITTEPSDLTLKVGETASLTLNAAGTGDLTYQWYGNTTNSIEGWIPIVGAGLASYSVPTDIAGTTYYYCAVTNTDTTVNGNPTAVTNSRVAQVTVSEQTNSPIDQIIAAVQEAIDNEELYGNGNPDKLQAFIARLQEVKLKIETGDITAAINVLESIYKQIDGQPSPKDLVVGDSAAEIAQMIQNLIDELKS